MKKRFLILAGVLALTVAVSGCGKKKDTDVQPVAASATPTPEVTKAAEIVDMKQPQRKRLPILWARNQQLLPKLFL